MPALLHMRANLDQLSGAKELARLCSLSVARFYTLFQSAFGIPPARYHRFLRLEAASRQLTETNETLEAIAERCGFSSPYHLSHSFKSHFGRNPRAFRREEVPVR